MSFKSNLKKLFNIFYIDDHIILVFFGIRVRLKFSKKYSNPTVSESGVTDKKREIPIVVSFTSFPERINSAYITAKSLLNQTMKPDYVILYLADEQFKNKENDIPEKLLELERYGLEIRWYKDIRSYKKLIPALLEFSNSIIITFDDDIIYDKNVVELLYSEHLNDEECIIASRSARLYLKNDEIKNVKISEQIVNTYSNPSYLNRLTGCGGVLYPPNCFYRDVLDENIFYNLIPTHDDVWFWAMCVLNDKKVKVLNSYDKPLIKIENSQSVGLCKINNSKKGMDTTGAYKIIVDKYPEILKKLKMEILR